MMILYWHGFIKNACYKVELAAALRSMAKYSGDNGQNSLTAFGDNSLLYLNLVP